MNFRTFHLTGRGLDDCMPQDALCPVVMNELAGLPAPERLPGSLAELHAAALAQARKGHRQKLLSRVQDCAARLHELLLVDQSREAVSATRVADSMGSRVRSFFRTEVLAQALRRPADPSSGIEPHRRHRCESLLNLL